MSAIKTAYVELAFARHNGVAFIIFFLEFVWSFFCMQGIRRNIILGRYLQIHVETFRTYMARRTA